LNPTGIGVEGRLKRPEGGNGIADEDDPRLYFCANERGIFGPEVTDQCPVAVFTAESHNVSQKKSSIEPTKLPSKGR
jgi:hypothetical protein